MGLGSQKSVWDEAKFHSNPTEIPLFPRSHFQSCLFCPFFRYILCLWSTLIKWSHFKFFGRMIIFSLTSSVHLSSGCWLMDVKIFCSSIWHKKYNKYFWLDWSISGYKCIQVRYPVLALRDRRSEHFALFFRTSWPWRDSRSRGPVGVMTQTWSSAFTESDHETEVGLTESCFQRGSRSAVKTKAERLISARTGTLYLLISF